MGCGESKHDVATGNTITRNGSNVGESVDSFVQQESSDSLVKQEGDNNIVNSDKEGDNNLVAIKEIAENETKEEHETGSLVSKESPNHFFSSRKDEEAIEGIVSEGRSEYHSPHVEAAKDSLFNENIVKQDDVINEEKILVQETKEETKTGTYIHMSPCISGLYFSKLLKCYLLIYILVS
ncbi:hypothetical protein CFOL_v3_30789 [Cephalotus follicularis]|uniref:Uncharacterized protein n=1 Tax=Cephalotus follicularis TaxID=3775 RepID=A0A1Q3D4X5_CEPFO|nr:hypothetical protein CFOL_v3_30789 [Cephalotus follicularis]